MKLSSTYFRIRTILVVLPISLIVLVYFGWIVWVELNTSKEDLRTENYTLVEVYQSDYVHERFLKPDQVLPCIEIVVNKPPHFIRLSDTFHEEKWTQLLADAHKGDNIQISFNHRLFQDSLILNPSSVVLNGVEIIRFEDNQRILIYGFIGIFAFLILFLIGIKMAWSTYKSEMLDEDKIQIRDGKRKFL